MKKAIYTLFAIAALAVCLKSFAAAIETKWILVVVVFVDNEAIDSAMVGFKSEAECKNAQAEMGKRAKEQGVNAWTDCVVMKREITLPPSKSERKS